MNLKLLTLLGFSIGLALLGSGAHAQGAPPSAALGSPLAGLALPQSGVARHEGSWDRSGGNGDARGVAPGETITLLDAKGAGVIRRFWVTIAPRAEVAIHSQAILRMYWDGEATPSVEVPVGAFFGVGFGEQVDYISTPLNETSGGYNCYWPMPFHKSARWTLTNLSKRRLDAFYYNVDYLAYQSLPKAMRHFHAQYRRENPTRAGRNYTFLEATGQGHYVGSALFMRNLHGAGLGFLEGDEMVYVDGETKPSINGTGTEDYFSSGWYFDRGTYSAPYHGVIIKDDVRGRVSAYRWHIEDPIPFTKSLRFTIEHGHANDHEADYASVAYWYQTEPHAPFPPLPKNAGDLLPYGPPEPMNLKNAVEGEALLPGAKATNGPVELQAMSSYSDDWSKDTHLWWKPERANETLSLSLPAPRAGDYTLTGYFTQAPDYGIIQIALNGADTGLPYNLFNPGVRASGPIPLGKATLKAGDNDLTVRVTGKDNRATGYLVGIDAFTLTPAP